MNRLERGNGGALPRRGLGPQINNLREQKKFAFVIGHLGPGGAQRVAVNAANALVDRGFDVHVIVLNDRLSAYRVDPRVAIHFGCPMQAALSGVDADNDELTAVDDVKQPTARIRPLVIYVRPNWEATLIAIALRLLNPNSRILWLARRFGGWAGGLYICGGRSGRSDPSPFSPFSTQTNILTVLATRGLATHTVISERNDPRLQSIRPRRAAAAHRLSVGRCGDREQQGRADRASVLRSQA